ncbi:hypothetical protein [Chryseolinea sp. H1M3-3]|uniref:hypothetical protein n=1 Tax=Chryseolinea sp. H1M3-3 TaxID=3034144 RepID=UPI0023ECE802|nr:hypothetical protein [Chryseolinea sp. H1M3-3]
MKTLSIFFLLQAWFSFMNPSFIVDNKYAEAMAKNIQTVYSSQSISELQSAVNSFERIGATEKIKWEPYYYAGFGYIMLANVEQSASKKDLYLDQALKAIEAAKKIKAKDVEITALEGFVHMIRLSVDPASRGQQYSSLAMQNFSQALSIDSENPRALALMAQMEYGTAQFFGSSTKEACATNESALQKFTTFKSDNPFAPQWGKAMAEKMKLQCKD